MYFSRTLSSPNLQYHTAKKMFSYKKNL